VSNQPSPWTTPALDPAAATAAPRRKLPDPFALVIFGASGDLTRRKLVPAVYCLFREGRLPDTFSILGFARTEKTEASFREELRKGVERFSRLQPVDDEAWQAFASRIFYHRGDYDEPEAFDALRQRLRPTKGDREQPLSCLFYLATPPGRFAPVVEQLHAANLLHPVGVPFWSRVIIEKPFGRDLASARALNQRLRQFLSEDQLFRIDHYLGKETVQNILVLRFANSLFEPLWNHRYVDHVQLTVSETVGVESRGGYYDQSGALRDMVQNHLMHLLCLVAMEPPSAMDANSVRDEKVKVLKALRPLPAVCFGEDVVRAQYARGMHQWQELPGYDEEAGIAADSHTETYAALRVWVDNWRWEGVPFYLRTGKRLPERLTEIGIHFKPVPRVLFNTGETAPLEPNVLALRIQPDEGISLQFQVKVPGSQLRIRPLKMDFGYAESFGKEPPEAYERLVLDAASGDPTLFTRSDEVEAAWTFLDPILDACNHELAPKLPTYPAGTWGPQEADDMLTADGRVWQVTRRSQRQA
jgi:glucose-6-phosphate 1-dehydrogenase